MVLPCGLLDLLAIGFVYYQVIANGADCVQYFSWSTNSRIVLHPGALIGEIYAGIYNPGSRFQHRLHTYCASGAGHFQYGEGFFGVHGNPLYKGPSLWLVHCYNIWLGSYIIWGKEERQWAV